MSTNAEMAEKARALRGLPEREGDAELVVRLGWRLSFSTGDLMPAAVIEQPRQTPSGRAGKPTHMLMLIGDEGIPALLRQVADLLDPDGPAIVGTTAPPSAAPDSSPPGESVSSTEVPSDAETIGDELAKRGMP